MNFSIDKMKIMIKNWQKKMEIQHEQLTLAKIVQYNISMNGGRVG